MTTILPTSFSKITSSNKLSIFLYLVLEIAFSTVSFLFLLLKISFNKNFFIFLPVALYEIAKRSICYPICLYASCTANSFSIIYNLGSFAKEKSNK